MSVLCCGCLQSQERGFLTPIFLLAETWEAKRDVEPSNSAPLKTATLKSSSMPQILSASLRWDSLHMTGNLIYWKTLKDKSGDILYLSQCQQSTFKNKLIWLTSIVCVAKASCTKWHVQSYKHQQGLFWSDATCTTLLPRMLRATDWMSLPVWK